MRTAIAFCAAAALLSIGSFAATQSASDVRTDVQLRAMTDELARSKTLQLNNLDKPYFIQFTSDDADELSITASLGGITSSTRLHVRRPGAEVRVGDYNFDNTNSIYSGTARLNLFPVDDDYQAMRTVLWRSADEIYKEATDQITRKRNALREMAEPDTTPDLAPAKVVHLIDPVEHFELNQPAWNETLRQISGRFAMHPGVATSSLRLEMLQSTFRLVNSEGTLIRTPENLSELEIRASGMAADGSRVWNHRFVTVLNPSQLPEKEQLARMADAVASETEALATAPAGEDYSGPVVFEGEASAEMMAQVLTDAIRLRRKPLAPPGSSSPALQGLDSVWSSRIGSKVLPEWLSIVDDPLQTQFKSTSLAGHYAVDDEGVPAERVTLVDKGSFRGFLLSRSPVRTFNASNGHGRLPGSFGDQETAIGNIFVTAAQTVPEAQLKARLIEKVKAAGLKYGLLIRSMDFPSTASLSELQGMARQLQRNGFARTLNSPILAFRVYPDGHEELVRGLRFREFSAKDLRDIEAASDVPYVLNYVNNGSSFNLAGMGSDITTSSVICPSLLFESLELTRAEDEAGTLPLVPPPALTATR